MKADWAGSRMGCYRAWSRIGCTMAHESRLIYALWQLRQVLPRALDEELEPLGISMSQFGTLNALAVKGALSGADLARRAAVRPQTMSVALVALVEAGLLDRRPHPVHRRVVLFDLTSQGRQLWRRADHRVERVENRFRDVLGGTERMREQTLALVDALGGMAQDLPVVWPPSP